MQVPICRRKMNDKRALSNPLVAAPVRETENVSAPALVEAINRCERALRAAFPQVRWLFFEPDVEK